MLGGAGSRYPCRSVPSDKMTGDADQRSRSLARPSPDYRPKPRVLDETFARTTDGRNRGCRHCLTLVKVWHKQFLQGG